MNPTYHSAVEIGSRAWRRGTKTLTVANRLNNTNTASNRANINYNTVYKSNCTEFQSVPFRGTDRRNQAGVWHVVAAGGWRLWWRAVPAFEYQRKPAGRTWIYDETGVRLTVRQSAARFEVVVSVTDPRTDRGRSPRLAARRTLEAPAWSGESG